MTTDYHAFLHNASLVMLVAAPVLILLPPRKLDMYTFGLGGAFLLSGNHLLKERSGRGLLDRVPSRGIGIDDVPTAKAREVQEALKRHREAAAAAAAAGVGGGGERTMAPRLLDDDGSRTAETAAADRRNKPRGLGIEEKAKEIWMGGEAEGWKERRLREEQERIAKGEGYGSMIMDQIWEVWNWGGQKKDQQQGLTPTANKNGTDRDKG